MNKINSCFTTFYFLHKIKSKTSCFPHVHNTHTIFLNITCTSSRTVNRKRVLIYDSDLNIRVHTASLYIALNTSYER